MKNPESIILILENDHEDQSALKNMALDAAFPFNVIMAATLSEALIRLKKQNFHAVISVANLEDGVGTDLIPVLGGTPLIIMVSEGNEEDALKALHAGANDYLIKDNRHYYLKLLSIIVNKSIEQKLQQRELDRYRTQLENIVEERTNELIDMYGKLRESETNFRNIFNSTNDGMAILDFDLNLIEVNSAVLKELEVTKAYLCNHDLLETILRPSSRNIVLERKNKLINGMAIGSVEIEIKSPTSNKIIPFEITSVPIVFNQKNAILTVLRNISERKALANKLFEAIIQTEEEERSRIARDLHDEIGPLISALKIYTTTFIESNNVDKKNKLAGQMGIIIRDVIESIKNISNDMSPHVLVNFGLPAAVRNFMTLFSQKIEIKLTSNFDNLRFSSLVESVIYRIFKELINNTVKHAGASEIAVGIDYTDPLLVCNYRDNGMGFDWQQQVNSNSTGMGIINIVSRIQSLGGNYEIHAEPGHGFEINFTFNISPSNADNKKEK